MRLNLPRILKNTYPLLIFIGVVATAELTVVQAGIKHSSRPIQACTFLEPASANTGMANRAPSCSDDRDTFH